MFDGANAIGTPMVVGSFVVSITAIDSVGVTAVKSLTLVRNTISGTPTTAGTYMGTLTATDAVGVTAAVSFTLTINSAPANFTVPDEAKGKITAVAADYLMVGGKKLIWNANTKINVNTPNGVIHVINSFVKKGMKVQWKGLRDKATNTVLTSQLEIN